VDRLEVELTDHFLVIRLDVLSDVGKYVRQKYHGGVVPTFIVFDKGGNEVWRHSGSVPELETILLPGL
jgi:thioredoxin-related protein